MKELIPETFPRTFPVTLLAWEISWETPKGFSQQNGALSGIEGLPRLLLQVLVTGKGLAGRDLMSMGRGVGHEGKAVGGTAIADFADTVADTERAGCEQVSYFITD
jgi:hypothetical protein